MKQRILLSVIVLCGITLLSKIRDHQLAKNNLIISQEPISRVSSSVVREFHSENEINQSMSPALPDQNAE